ncbi:hypothetical protein RQP53_06110 [Paucibacter sp. APW11]|uniref:TetR transcriptional regulator CgmR-like C-terminal domain-containing protein n=1 Tax=Roseateles aquae TaxID=3077235 RepID=A0ABU3P8D5_9BURK|nr:hypothetical protein [Paucibacter sp. APW11]MDT8998837.1 hypothetical protein [Paucibacter sp. APW11]
MELTLREVPGFVPAWSFAAGSNPAERRGRSARRQALVALRLSFSRAAAELQGPEAARLQALVRQACEPIELWLLQAALATALSDDEVGEAHRRAMRQALAAVFSGSPLLA